jgi:hypothetical protein
MKILFSLFVFSLSTMGLYAQSEVKFLFIGASFFRFYDLPDKFKFNYEKASDNRILVAGSLHDGSGFYHQIQSNYTLIELLKKSDFDYIIIDCYRLLVPGSVDHMSNAIKLLRELSPQTKYIFLTSLVSCFEDYPRYECSRISSEVECNIYKDCIEVEDSLNRVSNNLLLNFANLKIIPFFQLKERLKELEFTQKADIWAHPSDEMQEILARFIVYWIAKLDNSPIENFNLMKLNEPYKTITQNMMDDIMRHFKEL